MANSVLLLPLSDTMSPQYRSLHSGREDDSFCETERCRLGPTWPIFTFLNEITALLHDCLYLPSCHTGIIDKKPFIDFLVLLNKASLEVHISRLKDYSIHSQGDVNLLFSKDMDVLFVRSAS